ncbi:MAG TPA: DUF3108 domain-containing protein [Devosiaceae bacterium]
MARSKGFGAVAALVLASTLVAAPAAAAPMAGTASYVITLGGINIATVGVNLNDDGKRYDMEVSANVSGLGQMVASGTAKVDSAGLSTSPVLTSQKFDLLTHANGEDFSIKVGFAGKNVSSFVVNPPIVDNVDRVPIERSHLSNVNDFLASFVIKGGSLDKSLCNRKMHVFTGVERFDLAMNYNSDDTATSPRTGYQGPVVLCSVRYMPISGHFTTSEITNYLAKSDRILVWYAPYGDTGYFIPYRALLSTNMGDLSMVLTAMQP